MCALYRNHSIWQACSLGKSHRGFVSTGYDHWVLCCPGSFRDQAALVVSLGKWGIKHTKPHIPVIPMEGKWFLLEGMGGTGKGGEDRGIHPLFSVPSSPFISVFLFWSNARWLWGNYTLPPFDVSIHSMLVTIYHLVPWCCCSYSLSVTLDLVFYRTASILIFQLPICWPQSIFSFFTNCISSTAW